MKMIVITSIAEDRDTVTQIMKDAGVPVFSVSETMGHKTEHQDNLKDNWFFGRTESDTAALLYFSFTEDEKAGKVLQLVLQSNHRTATAFPIRAFILPVEASSYN